MLNNPSTTTNETSLSSPKNSFGEGSCDLALSNLTGPFRFNGDNFQDANEILKSQFGSRLIKLGGNLHFFNGAFCEALNDSQARRAIGFILSNWPSGVVSHSRIKNTLAVLKDNAPDGDRANPPDLKVHFKNGVYNLASQEFEQHTILNRNTRTLNVNYNGSTYCPKFVTWINTIFDNDKEKVQLLKEILGWTLCRNNLGIEKAVMLIGPPRAGKGVILRILNALHGDGYTPFILGDLTDDKRLSGMWDAHVAVDSDSVNPNQHESNKVVGLFKAITSNEPVSIKKLYTQNPTKGPLNCKLLISANSSPTLQDSSTATTNRWLPLIFEKSFLGNENPNLVNELLTESDGVALWALEGLKSLMQRGYFVLPKCSNELLGNMQNESSDISDFAEDSLLIDTTAKSTDQELWETFKAWTIRANTTLPKRAAFLKSLEDALRGKGVERKKSILQADGKFKRGFKGIKVLSINP